MRLLVTGLFKYYDVLVDTRRYRVQTYWIRLFLDIFFNLTFTVLSDLLRGVHVQIYLHMIFERMSYKA